ncbi:hypothetical protein BT63DRAFT_375820 [Microthyrium microscopicum]|uniref:Microtubule associated protein n=1 Tax=Microthyrium microscopicum TaxID=703497 RepID=A0A6A6U665_9PEZI|nr:hypothetical protein BT63DRAFT_375820 [Microthyrium microscopicum]
MDTSYLEKQVSTIVNKLHELFDEIGIPSHERDSRESELFAALSETLHNQLKLVTNEKHALAEEADKLITTIKHMTISLEGKNANYELDEDLKVTYPLKACLQSLKERHKAVNKVHRERYEQVKKLALAIDSYSSHLEPTFCKVPLPPLDNNATCPPTFDLSHTYFAALDDEFTRVYEEYQRRLDTIRSLCGEIINFWAELGTPQAQTDSNIVELAREAPEQLGLHSDDIGRLRAKRDRLSDEKKARENRLRDIGNQIEQLWERLCIPEDDKRQFLARNRGCGMRTINEFEDELGRLTELKKQNLGLFVEESRIRLQDLWDSLYFSEEEMLNFTPAFSDVYSDALLAAHESEIERLENLREQRQPILDMIDKHRTLINERNELAASSQDASRLMLRGQKGEKRDPTRLLREEKMRKRIAKDLPKVEVELKKVLEKYDQEYGRPFLVHGIDYLEELAAAQAKAPPPRSKTPSGHSRSQSKPTNSVVKNGTVKAAPQSNLRSKTPTNFATIRGNPLSQSVAHKSTTSTSKATSPSRIPARAPLSNTHGNNSPERKYMTLGSKPNMSNAHSSNTMGPPRLPPPKMKDLFNPPQPQSTPTYSRPTPDLERSASIIRQTAPEDPYDDPSLRSTNISRSDFYGSHSLASSAHTGERSYTHAPPAASRPQSRQISQQSAASTQSAASNQSASVVSGSENWETFDEDVSVEEADATDAYYAKVRAQQARYAAGLAPQVTAHKRMSPDGWQAGVEGKRLRNGGEEEWADDGVY